MLPTRSSCRIAQLVQNQSTQASCAQSPSPGLPSAPGSHPELEAHRGSMKWMFEVLKCWYHKSSKLDIDIVLDQGKWPILSRDRFWISPHPLTIGVSSQPNSIVSGPSSDFMWFLHISTCFYMYFWRPVSVYPFQLSYLSSVASSSLASLNPKFHGTLGNRGQFSRRRRKEATRNLFGFQRPATAVRT